MPELTSAPPVTPIEPVTEILHGVPVTDPYRWLEDQNSPRTRVWIHEQTRYARSYLDNISGRERIRDRIREFLAVEIYDSLRKSGDRYFFRKRLPEQEQPCIYVREGADGEDELLVDPSARGTGKYTAVRPLRVSPNGRLLLYEVKEGGERTGTFEILDVQTRRALPDVLPRGYLRGFAFAPDEKGFYYVHETVGSQGPSHRTAYHHVLGTAFAADAAVFCAGKSDKLRLCLITDRNRLGFLVCDVGEKTLTSFYLRRFEDEGLPQCLVADADFSVGPLLIPDRILAITDRGAPNRRIVEIRLRANSDIEWIDIVPENENRIHQWIVAGDRILVSYVRRAETRVCVFDLDGKQMDEWPVRTEGRTVRFIAALPDSDELMIETESFTQPPSTLLCSVHGNRFDLWARRKIPFDSDSYGHRRVWYISKDGTQIPMFLMGRQDVLNDSGSHPAIMTSYGGYGVSMTPQFSVFVAFLVEQGCLFALPNIRGGSEFGAEWHNAAKRRNRQTAYDDFLAAAQWLTATGRTSPDKLAIFGGSNSGLLVGAAMTQRPDLFRAVVCMVPMLDMLRYHLFDNADVWREEFGTTEDPDDFAALFRYSPYHRVRNCVAYPATLMVSGDADQNCNALHARKMTARLQANSSHHPIVLDYSHFRGHSPVLPLSDRIEALTDRMAFLCDQLRLPV
jgi:prolyl oligopeptidase